MGPARSDGAHGSVGNRASGCRWADSSCEASGREGFQVPPSAALGTSSTGLRAATDSEGWLFQTAWVGIGARSDLEFLSFTPAPAAGRPVTADLVYVKLTSH